MENSTIIFSLLVICFLIVLCIFSIGAGYVYMNADQSSTTSPSKVPNGTPTGSPTDTPVGAPVDTPANVPSTPTPKYGLWTVREKLDYNGSKNFCEAHNSVIATKTQLKEAFNNRGPLHHTCSFGWLDGQIIGINNGSSDSNCGPVNASSTSWSEPGRKHTSVYCYGKVPDPSVLRTTYDTNVSL